MVENLSFVLNWKMGKSYSDTIFWLSENRLNLLNLARKTGHEFVLCPSFESLESVVKTLEETGIKIGAQDCSSYNLGAYTGEVSAVSLKEVGCDYCIIGHSERRHIFGQTSLDVAKKAKLLFENNIMPIICVGETEDEKKDGLTFEVISQQLDPIMEIIAIDKIGKDKIKTLVIAYEPVWAIGTGNVPDLAYLNKIVTWLEAYFSVSAPGLKTKILYGGSIDPETVKRVSQARAISGFLVGRASLDFQTIEKIVLSI